jgi:hypothetical protein
MKVYSKLLAGASSMAPYHTKPQTPNPKLLAGASCMAPYHTKP